jgi:hypothetical protein
MERDIFRGERDIVRPVYNINRILATTYLVLQRVPLLLVETLYIYTIFREVSFRIYI